MPIRRHLATAAVAGALTASALGLALAGPAGAAPTPSPSAPSQTGATRPALPTVAPAPARTQAPVIAVPAGNVQVSKAGGASDLDLAALFAAGIVLAGGATVVATRRRV